MLPQQEDSCGKDGDGGRCGDEKIFSVHAERVLALRKVFRKIGRFVGKSMLPGQILCCGEPCCCGTIICVNLWVKY